MIHPDSTQVSYPWMRYKYKPRVQRTPTIASPHEPLSYHLFFVSKRRTGTQGLLHSVVYMPGLEDYTDSIQLDVVYI